MAHLSLQTANGKYIEPKQEQKLAVEAFLSLGKYAMGELPTGFGKTIIYESFVLLKDTGDSNQTPSIVVVVPHCSDSTIIYV